jgi:hypothetical protein
MVAKASKLQVHLEHANCRPDSAIFPGLLDDKPLHHLPSLLVLMPLFGSEMDDSCFLLLAGEIDTFNRSPDTDCF